MIADDLAAEAALDVVATADTLVTHCRGITIAPLIISGIFITSIIIHQDCH